MEHSLYSLYNQLLSERIQFCYSGPIAQSSIEGVGETLRRKLELEAAGNATTLAVFSIFIEQVQNVLNYSAEKLQKDEQDDRELRVGVIVIGQDQIGNYTVSCGNKVYNRDIPRIQESIEYLKSLSKDELKVLYRERRRQQSQPGSRGAGLGLIEMARRSAAPMSYAFEQIDDEVSFFSIKVSVGR